MVLLPINHGAPMRAFLSSWIVFFCVAGSIQADEIFLRDNLMKARPGDYIVTAQGNNYTLLLIREKGADTLVIEEITVPNERFPRAVPTWRQWVEEGAPGNTAWVIYEIAPASGQMYEFFSYTKNGWCDVPSAENFLGTLLNLRLARLDSSARRRVGPMPREGNGDKRPFWNPKLVVEGRTIPGVAFHAWKTRWPKDGSELSGKTIEVYLPQEGDKYPSYFPYWLQIGGAIGKAKVRIIDSGFGLQSPKPNLPLRSPTFLNAGRFEDGVFRLWLKTRPYYRDYQVFAYEMGAPDKLFPISYSLLPTDTPDVLVFQVSPDKLQRALPKGGLYRFVVKPRSHQQVRAETSEAISWSPYERRD